ncbi:hypothetical protein DMN91_005719 [Ooceraea biroi]|uniref:Nucleoporin NUP42 n=1 Tax=Ooceraea biroi TaxID=2015173 RepID=A0A3L8DLZ5_OOCBI|nr:nucleoporin NUP42 [Ooceraea biroi]RLU21346.1 hypothetical protein DMN91_005719 [Ooceraea biroi]
MVVCKYYRQGNCRYGQYCQYEHINNFGDPKVEYDDELVVTVVKEVLLAEKGGQWLLSSFGPLKERPCIPGLEDVSPEEVRWEMYQARKNGMVEQAKLRFQQLCQDMKAKRGALKNPTRETIAMLKKILGSGQKASQLGLANNTSTNNVFANKTYGVQSNNPFGGGGFGSSNNASSIFGKTNTNPAPVFGGTAAFGNSLGGFGTATSANSIFSGTTNTLTSFSSVQNNTPAFGTSQNNSIFGPSPSVFGQSNNVFSGNQLGNTSSTSLFNSPMTSQANNSLFGNPTTTTANLFGGSSSSNSLQTNLIFGGPTTSSNSFSGNIFNQSKTQLPAFGGAPVFGGIASSNYSSNSSNSIFGSQTFGTPAMSTNNIFGSPAATTTPAFGAPASTMTPAFGSPAATTPPVFGSPTASAAPAFGASAASTTPAFGASAATTTSAFGTSVATTTPGFDLNQQSNNNAFGAAISTSNIFGAQTDTAMSMSNSAPFGALATAISSPFVTANSQQFDPTNSNSTPFAGAGFGMAATNTNNTFGTTASSSNSIFANAGTTFATSNSTVPNPSPFSNVNASLPFGPTNGTAAAATAVANPFAPRTLQSNAPFGNVQNQLISTSSPFGKSPFNVSATNVIIDDIVYSAEGSLTDDEKSMYLAEKFIIGKIPLKPPTKDVR